jgi:hypothetical protein
MPHLHSLIRRLQEKQDGLYIFFPQRIPTMKGVPWMPRGAQETGIKQFMDTVNIQARKK